MSTLDLQSRSQSAPQLDPPQLDLPPIEAECLPPQPKKNAFTVMASSRPVLPRRLSSPVADGPTERNPYRHTKFECIETLILTGNCTVDDAVISTVLDGVPPYQILHYTNPSMFYSERTSKQVLQDIYCAESRLLYRRRLTTPQFVEKQRLEISNEIAHLKQLSVELETLIASPTLESEAAHLELIDIPSLKNEYKVLKLKEEEATTSTSASSRPRSRSQSARSSTDAVDSATGLPNRLVKTIKVLIKGGAHNEFITKCFKLDDSIIEQIRSQA